MGMYSIKFKIGDTVFWIKKKLVGWSSTSTPCPECQKYGAYENITHDVFINSQRRKCVRGILLAPYYRYELKSYTICSIFIRKNREGEDIVYYIDESGINHLASNTFATKASALSALRTLCKI